MCVHCIQSLLLVENRQKDRKSTGENKPGCYYVTGYHSCCHSNQCNMADCVFFWILWAQYKFIFRPVSYSSAGVFLLYNQSDLFPTLVAPPMFDDNGPPAARLLLSLGHTLSSLIVRVICSVDCHLLLNHPETRQLLSSTGRREDNNLTQTSSTCYQLKLKYCLTGACHMAVFC